MLFFSFLQLALKI